MSFSYCLWMKTEHELKYFFLFLQSNIYQISSNNIDIIIEFYDKYVERKTSYHNIAM